jgi:uncharacterized membrane protein YjjP (DUF1212 family)
MTENNLSTEAKLDLLIRAGGMLLENGAAAYRVDETLTALGEALGLTDVEVFAIPTGLILGASGPEGAVTKVSHITEVGVNMNRLAEVSSLARDAAKMTHDEIAQKLTDIESQKSIYPTWLIVGSVALTCGTFALLLGGGGKEFAAATFGGGLAMLLRTGLRAVRLVPFMVTVIAAFMATAASTLCCRVIGCSSEQIVQVASVLQLVPGVPMVTWVIDLATGDILSGVSRAAYAALMAMGIALGMLLFLVWGVAQ